MEEAFHRWTIDEVAGRRWVELLRVAPMSAGIYRLEAGAEDTQQPHREDELYCVLAGRAVFEVAGARHPVGPGTLLYVRADLAHRFVAITEPLVALVVFAPAET